MMMLMMGSYVSRSLRADRLMGFRENSKEVASNMPHVMQRETY